MTTITRTVIPPTGGVRVPRNAAAAWRHLDLALVGATLSLAAMGLVMVYSATQHRLEAVGGDPSSYLKRQALWLVLGLVAMVVMASLDYRLIRSVSPALFAGTVVLLLAVLSPLGSNSRGAQAWFQIGGFQFQPSEFAKVVLIVFLAGYCAQHRGDLDARRLGLVMFLAAIPMALIYRQPDLGTDLVFVAILMAILLVAGARPRHILVLTAVGVVAIVAVLQLGVLKQYQVDRLGAFLDPENDTQRSSYNLKQSVTAISTGGVTGKGLFQGTQTNLSFVPEQQSDFIFTVVGEELGFVGALTMLALFALVLWRTWRTATLARDLLGTLICVGVMAMLVFQIFENVGMTMGIMPITGIPLPFVSYGGSSTIACFAAIGLVLNVHSRRFG